MSGIFFIVTENEKITFRAEDYPSANRKFIEARVKASKKYGNTRIRLGVMKHNKAEYIHTANVGKISDNMFVL